jgi:hypothetical protein
MSEQHDEAHTGPIKTPKQFLLMMVLSFMLPVFIIIGLVYYITADHKPALGASNPEKATVSRIERVGDDVEVLGSINNEPVLVRQGNVLAASFHPELSNDARLHEYFVSITANRKKV